MPSSRPSALLHPLTLALLFASLLAVLLLPSSASAEPFGKEIMAQQFDEKPFRQIEIPAWLLDVTGYVYTGPDHYDMAAEHGAQATEIAFGSPQYFHYDSKFISKDPNLPPNHIENRIAAAKKAGLRIIGAIPPCLQAEVYTKHPDWRGISKDTKEIPSVDLAKRPEGGWVCQMGPWGDYMIEILAEIMTKYPDVVGFGFDGIHHTKACYCQHCREAFRKDLGKEMPDMAKGLDDPEVRVYEEWLNRRMERFVERIQTRIKGINKDAVLLTWTTAAGRFGHLRSVPTEMSTRMNLLFDAPAQEFWLDETNRGNTIVPAFANAYIWAVTNHRQAFSEPYLFSHGNPYGSDSFPTQEVRRRVLLALTHGAQASLAIGWKKNLVEGEKLGFQDIKARAPWLTHKQPEPYAALLMSENTRLYYGRSSGKVEERYLANVFGAFRTALEEHIPAAIINDWNLNAEDLKGYKVLVLPNAVCLNDQQVAAIREFVTNGGGLVASQETSLFDATGNNRPDFALSDLFAAHYKGIPSGGKGQVDLDINFMHGVDASYWEKRKNIFSFKPDTTHVIFDHPLIKEYLAEDPVTFKGPAVTVEPTSSAQLIAKITPDGGKDPLPGMIVNQAGKGRVVYLPAGLDHGYYMYPYPYQRLILAQSIRWAAQGEPSVRVKAPMCVQSSVFRQKKDGERLVVHLYNNLNTTGGNAFPNDDVPLREEVLPINDIEVRFDASLNIKKFHLEPGGMELTPKTRNNMNIITVPPLHMHCMVVAEL